MPAAARNMATAKERLNGVLVISVTAMESAMALLFQLMLSMLKPPLLSTETTVLLDSSLYLLELA